MAEYHRFNWALEQMLQGKLVKRRVSSWDPIHYVGIDKEAQCVVACISGIHSRFDFSDDDLMAWDWCLASRQHHEEL